MQIPQINVVNFFENIEEGIKKLNVMLEGKLYTERSSIQEEIKSITYVCSDFDIYSKLDTPFFAEKILSILKNQSQKKVKVKVYSFAQLSEKLLEAQFDKNGIEHYYLYDGWFKTNKKSYEQEDNSIEVFSYNDKNNPLVSFFEKIKELAKNNYKSIYIYDKEKGFKDLKELAQFLIFSKNKDAIKRLEPKIRKKYSKKDKIFTLRLEETEKFVDEANENFYKELNTLRENLKEYIQKLDECEYYNNNIRIKVSNELNKAFKEFKEHLEHAIEEDDDYILKEMIKFIISLIDFTDIKASFKRYALPFVLLDAIKTGSNIYDFSQNKFRYTYSLPLYKLLNQQIAIYINLCRLGFYSNFLIINDKNIIDFSGFSLLNSQNIKSNLYKGLGFVGSIDNAYSFLNLIQNQKNTPLIENQNLNCIVKLQGDSPNENLLNLLTQRCNEGICFNFIEHPSFNSALFGEILKNKNEKAKENASYRNGLNYLIISNAPSFESARLDEDITQRFLNYTIKGQIKTKEPLGEYNPKIDYSQYLIDRKQDENPLCVVRLSPFVCIKKEEYEGFKELEQYKTRDIFGELETLGNIDIIAEGHQAEKELKYIDSFTLQAKTLEEIKEKSKELFNNFIKSLQSYLDSFNKNKGLVQKTNVFFVTFDSQEPCYSLIELLSISMGFYITKKQLELFNITYEIKNIDETTYFDNGDYETKFYQGIEFNQQKINFISQKAYIELENEQGKLITKRIFINKELKNKEFAKEQINDEDCIFLEDIVEYIINKDSDEIFEYKNQITEELKKDLDAVNTDDIKLFENEEIKNPISKEEYDEIEKEFKEKFKEQKNILEELDEYNVLEQIFIKFMSAFFPFVDYFGFDMRACMKRLLKYTMENYSFKKIIKEELGLSYLAILMSKMSKTKLTMPEKIKVSLITKKLTRIMIINERFVIMCERLEELNLILDNKDYYTKQALKALRIKNFKTYIQTYTKIKSKDFLQDITKGIALNLIDQLWVTTYEKLKKEFEELIFRIFTYKYDEPYAVVREHFVTYPLSVQSNFMCFDFKELLYGGNLCTGGLKYHLGVSYLLSLPNEELKQFTINKILSYIILDHHRHFQKIKDYIEELKTRNAGEKPQITAGKAKELENYFSKRIFNNPRTYKLSNDGIKSENPQESAKLQYELYCMYKSHQQKADEYNIPINAYNEALDILADILEGIYHNNTHNENDKDKMRRLLECLEIIGQNNIKAMYVGINDEEVNSVDESIAIDDKESRENNDYDKRKEKQPYFIGRLATTIIRYGRLWIG